MRGLPGVLPAGEHIVWQGAPDAHVFARRALHLRWIAAYFTAQLLSGNLYGVSPHDPPTFALVPVLLAAVAAQAGNVQQAFHALAERDEGAERGQAIRDWLLVRPGVPAMFARVSPMHSPSRNPV